MKSNAEQTYDVAIVGGGPAGLSAALVLVRACRRIIVVDAGQPRNAAAKEIHGFLSRDGIAPHDLRSAGREDLAKYGCEILEDVVCQASHVPQCDTNGCPTTFLLATKKGRRLVCRKVIFATGMRDKLPVFPGVRECYGTSIHHCPYCDGWEHRGKPLLAYGESAADAVGLGMLLRAWSADVTVLTNGQEVTDKERVRLKDSCLAVAQDAIVGFIHEHGQLLGVELEGKQFMPAAAMFFNTGERSRCDLAHSLGVECEDEFTGHTNSKQQTAIPGVFLAGDADGDVQFAIVAAAEGATAAVAINRELLDEDRGLSRQRRFGAPDSLMWPDPAFAG